MERVWTWSQVGLGLTQCSRLLAEWPWAGDALFEPQLLENGARGTYWVEVEIKQVRWLARTCPRTVEAPWAETTPGAAPHSLLCLAPTPACPWPPGPTVSPPQPFSVWALCPGFELQEWPWPGGPWSPRL